MNNVIHATFKQGSKTYFYSSVFFPKEVRQDVFYLYAFVRKADDFVDQVPQQADGFYRFWDSYKKARGGEHTGDVIVDSFVDLMHRKGFDALWVDAFLTSMGMDLSKNVYETIEETCEYMYGSAEVIGLMMAKVLGLHPDSYPYARALGRAMQYINFIRDIDEDLQLGRTYLPLKDSDLDSLSRSYAVRHEQQFTAYIHDQIRLYYTWQAEAEKGFSYIPKRCLIPIKTASDKYKWTAETIRQNPMLVYRRKVKPSVFMILSTGLRNAVAL